MADLERDYQYLLDHKEDLLKKYWGMYVVIANGDFIKSFAAEIDAYHFGVEQYGLGAFIVQLCTEKGYSDRFHFNDMMRLAEAIDTTPQEDGVCHVSKVAASLCN